MRTHYALLLRQYGVAAALALVASLVMLHQENKTARSGNRPVPRTAHQSVVPQAPVQKAVVEGKGDSLSQLLHQPPLVALKVTDLNTGNIHLSAMMPFDLAVQAVQRYSNMRTKVVIVGGSFSNFQPLFSNGAVAPLEEASVDGMPAELTIHPRK